MEAHATVFEENKEELKLEENIQLHFKMFCGERIDF